MVVNESLALRLWPDGQAVGERVMVGCKSAQPAVVIGVVRDSAIRALAECRRVDPLVALRHE